MIGRSTGVYAGISGLCMVLHNGVMILGDRAGWGLPASITASFCLVAITGYTLHSLFTFREPLRPERFARYVLAVSANIPLAFVTVWAWHDLVGLEMIWASPLATACMVGVNYMLSRWAILSPTDRFAR